MTNCVLLEIRCNIHQSALMYLRGEYNKAVTQMRVYVTGEREDILDYLKTYCNGK